MRDLSEEELAELKRADPARYWTELRALGPNGRLQRALELSEELRQRELAEIRQEHPDWSAAEVSAERVRRVFPEAAYLLAQRAQDV
jgi:hypothetical protein